MQRARDGARQPSITARILVLADAVTGLDMQRDESSGRLCRDRDLHLHAFDKHDLLALTHDVAHIAVHDRHDARGGRAVLPRRHARNPIP